MLAAKMLLTKPPANAAELKAVVHSRQDRLATLQTQVQAKDIAAAIFRSLNQARKGRSTQHPERKTELSMAEKVVVDAIAALAAMVNARTPLPSERMDVDEKAAMVTAGVTSKDAEATTEELDFSRWQRARDSAGSRLRNQRGT